MSSEEGGVGSEKRCPDCGEPLKRMELQGTNALGELTLVSEEPTDGFLSGLRSDDIRTPVAYVCPQCSRTLLYAE